MSVSGAGPLEMYLLGSLSGSTLTGVTTGTSIPVPQNGRNITLYLRSIGTTSGGALSIEEAGWHPNEIAYTGTWSVISAVNASTFSGTAQVAYHLSSPTPYQYIRVRISSNITGGGTIAVWMVAT